VTDKRFLLGVGAQKAGTSWLYGMLRRRSPDFAHGFAKEYHVWDALSLPEGETIRARFERSTVAAIRKGFEHWSNSGDILRLHMYADPEYYFDYFAGLLARSGARVTGDVSPEYAALTPETLARIVHGFARRGIAVKPVLLLRDPVARLDSWVRFSFFVQGVTPSRNQVATAMRRLAGSADDRRVADYPRTHAALTEAFGETGFFLGIYERFFTWNEVTRLADWLGADMSQALLDRRIGAVPPRVRHDPGFIDRLQAEYAPIYDFAATRLGPETVASWTAARLALSDPRRGT